MSVFVDSTTILYMFDRRDPEKAATCNAWLSHLLASRQLRMNLQVLNETYAVVLRKPHFREARPLIRDFVIEHLTWCEGTIDVDVIRAAWALQDRYGIQFWDSILLASARMTNCTHFLSEDLNDGQVYGGVAVVNPFRHSPEDVLGRALPR